MKYWINKENYIPWSFLHCFPWCFILWVSSVIYRPWFKSISMQGPDILMASTDIQQAISPGGRHKSEINIACNFPPAVTCSVSYKFSDMSFFMDYVIFCNYWLVTTLSRETGKAGRISFAKIQLMSFKDVFIILAKSVLYIRIYKTDSKSKVPFMRHVHEGPVGKIYKFQINSCHSFWDIAWKQVLTGRQVGSAMT